MMKVEINSVNDAKSPSLAADEGASQVVKTLLKLRQMVLSGDLAAGGRITELAMVDKLGVSRTPVRTALMRLEQEGLLEALPHGGYAVRTLTERDVSDAIALRGQIEGLMASLAAERGAPAVAMTQARQCLVHIDSLLQAPMLSDEGFSRYVVLNKQFHLLLGDLCGSEVLSREAQRIHHLPFASPSGFVLKQANSPQARDRLVVAQDQHWQVLDAIENGESGRAQAIMCEHSRLAQRNLREVVRSPGVSEVPGVQLIQQMRA
jgi:GntR family transcriptional regulator of vanillate catabolism